MIFGIICAILGAIFCLFMAGGGVQYGGAVPPAASNIVIDTLNIVHWFTPIQDLRKDIVKTITKLTPQLRKLYAGRIMYVIKDRESTFNTPKDRVVFEKLAKKAKVHIFIAEQYPNQLGDRVKSDSHAARGRDDFFMCLLAKKYRCPVLSCDRLRDFDEFRTKVLPFHVWEYNYWADMPGREFVNPLAYSRLRRPFLLQPGRVNLAKAKMLPKKGPRVTPAVKKRPNNSKNNTRSKNQKQSK